MQYIVLYYYPSQLTNKHHTTTMHLHGGRPDSYSIASIWKVLLLLVFELSIAIVTNKIYIYV